MNNALHALRSTQKRGGEVAQIVTAAAIAKDKAFPPNEDQFMMKFPAAILSHMQVAIVVRPVDNQVNRESISIAHEHRMDSDDSV